MEAGRSRMLMASGGNEPVADGGGSGHSVFAAAMLRGLREMGSARFTAAELFRGYVLEPVAGRAEQIPEYNPIRNSGHESGDFIFVRVKTEGKSVKVTVKAPATAPSGPAFDPAALDLAFWESVKNSTDPEDYKAYLEKFPSGTYAALARRRANPTAVPPIKSVGTNSSSDAKGRAQELLTRAVEANKGWRHDEVIELTTEAIRLDPQFADAYNNRAIARNRTGDYDMGLKDATEAIRLDPRLADAHNNRALSYYYKGDYEAVIANATEAIRLDPKVTHPYTNRGAAYTSMRDYDAAFRDFTEAIKLDPKEPAIYLNRGAAYTSKGDYDAAIRDLTEAIRLDPQRPVSYLHRAFAYEKLNDLRNAKADRDKAAELEKK